MTSAISAITATSAEPVAAAALPTAPADGAAVLQFRSALSQPDVSAPAPVDAARNAATLSAAPGIRRRYLVIACWRAFRAYRTRFGTRTQRSPLCPRIRGCQ